MKRILVALGPYPPIEREAITAMEKFAEVKEALGALTEDDLLQQVKGVNAVVLGAPKLTKKVIEFADELEVIARRGVGVDNIDIQAASGRGVVVTNCPGVPSPVVAEHSLLLMMGISKKIASADRSVRTGRWKDFNSGSFHEIRGKVLGIIGFGSIAIEVTKAASNGFQMRVITNDNPHIKQELVRKAGANLVSSLEELLRTSDYVLVTVPLTEETEGMIGERELAMMKPSSYLVNVARGKIVDERALYLALRDGKIAGAATDVMSKQPPDPDNPLLTLDNILFTPHDAALTVETQNKLSSTCINSISKLFSGELPVPPANVLNPAVAERYISHISRI